MKGERSIDNSYGFDMLMQMILDDEGGASPLVCSLFHTRPQLQLIRGQATC